MKTTYQITEYGSFLTGKQVEGYVTLPEATFEQLENFILSNKTKETDALELMELSAKRGLGKVITAKNYVGVLTMKDGTSIEILPKIYSKTSYHEGQIKQLVVAMLKVLRDSPYKMLQSTTVDIEKMNIFEIFVRMFIDEVFFLVKRGLKSSYETVSANETFFKGKLLFAEQLKHNTITRSASTSPLMRSIPTAPKTSSLSQPCAASTSRRYRSKTRPISRPC